MNKFNDAVSILSNKQNLLKKTLNHEVNSRITN